MKVLIIDDDAFDSNLIASSFHRVSDKVEVSILSDSREAEDLFKSMNPDLAVLDINMPDVDGFAVLSALNKLSERSNVSVVMLSNSTNPYDREKATKMGADGYCVKPSNLNGYRGLAVELISMIQQ